MDAREYSTIFFNTRRTCKQSFLVAQLQGVPFTWKCTNVLLHEAEQSLAFVVRTDLQNFSDPAQTRGCSLAKASAWPW